MRPPETQFVYVDGERIAYQVFGEGSIDLLYSLGTTSNIDALWEDPATARFNARLAKIFRVIRFDRRGAGASDPLPDGSRPWWECTLDDITAVLDAAGSEHTAILGYNDGSPPALAFTAAHPDRVHHLVLSTASARWLAAPDYPIGIPLEHLEAIIDGVSKGWGTTEFAAASFPSRANDPVFLSWIAKFNRTIGSATSIRAAFRSLIACDVRATLPHIRCPVLLMHAQDNAFIPADHSRYIAEHIPDARLEIFSGGDMNVQYEHEEAVLGLLEDFLTGGNRPAASERVLATVLFTDIVGSTQRAATMGDGTWHALLKQHDEIATAVTERFGGRIVKLTGDGVLATFTGPGRAIGCAQALIDALARLDLQIRAGAHTCEIEIRDGGDIAGIGVHIGARIMEHAGPGEVLVSRTVRDLVSGSDVTFADRGTHALKGVPNEWDLLAVE